MNFILNSLNLMSTNHESWKTSVADFSFRCWGYFARQFCISAEERHLSARLECCRRSWIPITFASRHRILVRRPDGSQTHEARFLHGVNDEDVEHRVLLHKVGLTPWRTPKTQGLNYTFSLPGFFSHARIPMLVRPWIFSSRTLFDLFWLRISWVIFRVPLIGISA